MITIVRLMPNGALDASFGENGVCSLPTVAGLRCASLLTDTDDGVFCAAPLGGSPPTSSLTRLHPSGRIDATFGVGGFAMPEIDSHHTGPNMPLVVTATDGKIIIGGWVLPRARRGQKDFALARFSRDGTPDVEFGFGGVISTDFAGRLFTAEALLADADNSITAVGTVTDHRTAHTAVLRYHGNGQLDTTFGHGGMTVGDFGGSYDSAHTAAFLPSRRVLIAGSRRIHADDRPAVAVYSPDGSEDATFASSGMDLNELSELTGVFTSCFADLEGVWFWLGGWAGPGQTVSA